MTTQSYLAPVKMKRKLLMKNTVTFFLWLIASFTCHWSARIFLTSSKNETVSSQLTLSLILTINQSSLFCVYWVISAMKNESSKLFWIKIVSHLLATFFTNYSMTFIAASSTFTVKLVEPVTSAMAQRIFQNEPVPRFSYLSLSIMIFGAIMFCSDDLIHLNEGMIFAFASNLTVAARNVAIRLEQAAETTTGKTINNNFKHWLTLIWLCIFAVIGTMYFAHLDSLERVVYLTLSSVLHVIYSYISTNVILNLTTVLGHAVLNVCKRMFVVISLYLIGENKASPSNWLGLILVCLACAGYFLSSSSVSSNDGHALNRVCHVGGRTKPFFLAFLLLVIVTVFSTSISISKCKTVILEMKESYLPYRRSLFNLENSTAKISDMYHPTGFNENIDNVSRYLKTSSEIIKEAQTIQLELFSRLLKPYKYVMLLDIAVIENKGDPAITVGELMLIRRLNKILVFYCNFHKCTEKNLQKASRMSKFFTPRKLIILLHGGGNLVGWVVNDHLRHRIFEHFKGFQFLLLPQSIFMTGTPKHLAFCQQIYRNHANLTMVLRDRNSFELAEKHFGGSTKLLMAPDMAFQIGSRRRFMMPFYDILWICRTDMEKVEGQIPPLPKNISIKVDDWLNWKTPRTENDVENAHLLLNNGFVFIQRGRVVITDRLHGHIFSTLLDIPHVVINNKWNKVSNYHNTWTLNHKYTRVANNQSHAINLAIAMLDEYASNLPQTVPFLGVMDKL